MKCSTHAVGTTTVFKSHNSLETVKRMLAALWSRVSEYEASQMSEGFLGGYDDATAQLKLGGQERQQDEPCD